jgi:hypothetical protein
MALERENGSGKGSPTARIVDQLLVAVRSLRSEILAVARDLLVGDSFLLPILQNPSAEKI